MTTYRLPDGAEVRAADRNLAKAPTLANHTWVIHPTLGAISCYTGILTPTLPPLPPEPGDDAYAKVTKNGLVEIFHRAEGDWWSVCEYQEEPLDWADLHDRGEVVVLVPDPAADAPPLPWRKRGSGDRYPADLLVERARDAGDVLEINGFGLAANQIRELMGICARHLKPGAERDALQAAAWAAREVQQP